MTMQQMIAIVLMTTVFGAAQAVPITSTGSGTAVSSVDATADFESQAALNDTIYVENGLSFSRTGLSYNNNGCGYAGCDGHAPFDGFTGNYMYGVGTDGYFDITTTGSDIFYGLEMVIGTGYSDPNMILAWTTFRDGIETASGTYDILATSVFGIADTDGFDTLRLTQISVGYAPAFDTVRADLGYASVNEPATAILFMLGLAGIVGSRKKRLF